MELIISSIAQNYGLDDSDDFIAPLPGEVFLLHTRFTAKQTAKNSYKETVVSVYMVDI